MTALDHDLDRLVARLHAHLVVGAATCGHVVHAPGRRLVDQQEHEHVCARALLFRIRLAGPHGRVERIGDLGGQTHD